MASESNMSEKASQAPANGAPAVAAPNGSITEKQPSAEPAPAATPRPPPLLCLGMARTGTASLVEALRILGFENVHHGLETNGPEHKWLWDNLDRAADASFPNLSTYTGKPFTREQWDEGFGRYDAVSDVASFFAMPLIRGYPDAKVILVERGIDRWYTSIQGVMKQWDNPWTERMIRWIGPYTGTPVGLVSLKMQMGWTRSTKAKDIYGNARAAYERHYREIREKVPAEQLLDFKLSEGWEPLCRFLGKEIPSVPFPHVNDAAAYETHRIKARKDALNAAAKTICCPCL